MQQAALQATEKKRKWVFAKKPSGPLYKKRQWVGYSLLLFLFASPFIKIKGEPFLLFGVLERKFVIFGKVFWPEDLYVFVFGMLIVLVCIVLFTAVYGRVWCGWTCPQTIFMELIFRPIEYWIEGDRTQQLKNKRNKHKWEVKRKKIFKLIVFYIISFFISNIFLAYLIGADALFEIITSPVSQHLGGFISILAFSFVFFFVFAYVRDIVCTHICPYGRLQSVLIDNDTTVIAYNYNRGEPRGRKSKSNPEAELGDCIDCNLCVQVCPTGIDIREGLQMECVSCTACIDACDDVMVKLNRPKRLIGFYTPSELLENKTASRKNKRAIAYTALLVVLIAIFGVLIFTRSDVSGTILRAKGSTYQLRDDGTVTNLYNLNLINKTNENMDIELEPNDSRFKIQVVNPHLNLQKSESSKMSLFLILPKEEVEDYKTNVRIKIMDEGKVLKEIKTTFIAPIGLAK